MLNFWRFAACAAPCCCTRNALWPFGPPVTTDMSGEPPPHSSYRPHLLPSVMALLVPPASVSQLLSKMTPPPPVPPPPPVELLTDTVTAALVVALPAASFATAVILCDPFATFVLTQLI